MDNLSQISLGFVEEAITDSTTPPAAREDQPVNIGVRIKKLKQVDNSIVTESRLPETATVQSSPLSVSSDTSAMATSPALSHSSDATISLAPPEKPAASSGAASSPVQVKIKSGRGRKSIRQIAEEADLIRIPDDEILFQKQYYTMGEVAEMFRVNQSLLRFWEAEFDILQPKKNKKGDRYFRPVDIKNLHLIYHLLRQRKYTIEGAKDFLRKGKKAEEKFEAIRKLEQIRDFLLEMKASIR